MLEYYLSYIVLLRRELEILRVWWDGGLKLHKQSPPAYCHHPTDSSLVYSYPDPYCSMQPVYKLNSNLVQC